MPKPILVLGIMPRCGSTWLANLIALHPHCRRANLQEDFFLYDSAHLLQFANALATRGGGSGLPVARKPELVRAIGDALLRFVTENPDQRTVLKTPAWEGWETAPVLFPDAQLVLLVRDGRDVVTSAFKSWNGNPVEDARKWASRVNLYRRSSAHIPHCLVRYEDLLCNFEATLRSLFQYLGLDASRFDFDGARDLGIFGHHANFREAGTQARPAPKGFDPVGQWRRELSETQQDALQAELTHVLAEMGYK